MYKTISSLGAIAALAATATAHGTTTGVTIDGIFTGGFKLDYYYAKQNGGPIPEHIGWYAENLDNGFVEPNSFNTADVICHKAASAEGSSDTLAKVAAGGTVEFHWTVWPESHVGPVITYVAPYSGDVASVKKEDLKWTKIQADGYADGEWAAINLIKNNNTAVVTVPENLAAGKYVFRHEIIALHGAGELNGAQSYPQCLNIEVTGSGTTVPEGVAGTAIYTADEEGIIFNPYAATIDYKIPGPPLFGASGSAPAPAPGAGSGSGSGNGTAPATPTKPATPSSTASAIASSAPEVSEASEEPSTPEASDAPSAPSTSAVASPAPSAGGNDSGALPEEFTIATFIEWLEGKAASNSKARRHARPFFG
ncbi:glycosyl hydrolase family 61-domain-containing protein [Ampelomyces quisqualis]|uniref:Glycosyl hydrolase family 61-domain-containing protein n=1 Tax=Ampelomyces quisqualis TaxID=50730 RepID=A0A6A5QL60_AMPQU|nr:glycosyl hydrolase family 61-domain-containing protein [Ampelomyces quisqualis]